MESECGDIRKDRKNRSSLRLEKHLIGEKESSCPLTIVDAGSDFVVDSTSTKWGLNTQLGDSLCPFIFIPSVSVSSSGSFPLPPIQAGHPRNRSFFRLRAPSPFLGIFAHSRQLTTVFLILSLTLQLLCSLATASPMVPISGDGEEGSKPTAKDGSLIHENQITTRIPFDYHALRGLPNETSTTTTITENDDLLVLAVGDKPLKETPDGDPIFEGDIVVPRQRILGRQREIEEGLAGRTAVAEPVLYWPGGVVVYSYHTSVTEAEKAVIESAMRHWEEETCITFRPRETLDYMYVRFRTDTPGCWSLVGRQFLRMGVGQDLSIGKGCAQHHVVTHEIGHAVGFFHEQSRSDRDAAIHINWDNVQEGFELQFNKEEDVNFGVGYDYLSVMQYPSWAFSKAVLEKNTIVTLNPKYQRLLGRNTKGLSFRDKAIINRLYECSRGCSNAGSAVCQNEGYLKPPSKNSLQSECACECPPNTSGKYCETLLPTDYYDSLEAMSCGGNVTEPGIIETPGYPSRTGPKHSCTWVIRAPIGKRVALTFEGFEFAPRHSKPGSKTDGKCFHEAVEIRLEDEFNGDHFCATDISPGTVMTSKSNEAIIIVLADDKMIGKGLRANVSFIDPNVSPTSQGGEPTSASVTTTPSSTTTDNGFDSIWKEIISSWRKQQQRTTTTTTTLRPWRTSPARRVVRPTTSTRYTTTQLPLPTWAKIWG